MLFMPARMSLLNAGGAATPRAAMTATYLGSAVNSADGTNYTGLSITVPTVTAPNTQYLVGIAFSNFGVGDFTSATLGGASTTLVHKNVDFTNGKIAMFITDSTVAGGTNTHTVVVSTLASFMSLALFALVGEHSAAPVASSDDDVTSGVGAAASLSFGDGSYAGGPFVGGSLLAPQDPVAGTCTTTLGTERVDQVIETNAGYMCASSGTDADGSASGTFTWDVEAQINIAIGAIFKYG